MSREEAKEKLLGYNVFLADSNALMPLTCEDKPKIVICCPNQKAMDDMQDILKALAALEKPAVCKTCNGSGKKRCVKCSGTGKLNRADNYSNKCFFCGGTGETTCPDCKPPTGQAKAEQVKFMLDKYKEQVLARTRDIQEMGDEITKLNAHIDRLVGEIKKLSNQKKYVYKTTITNLETKLRNIEGAAFAANEEAQMQDDKIKELEAELAKKTTCLSIQKSIDSQLAAENKRLKEENERLKPKPLLFDTIGGFKIITNDSVPEDEIWFATQEQLEKALAFSASQMRQALKE